MDPVLKRDFEYLLWLLSRREYPEKKLREKLRTRKLTTEQADVLMTELKERGFLSDERFRRARARQLTRRGEGPRNIKAKVKAETGGELAETEMHAVYEDLGTSSHEVLTQYLGKELAKLERSGRHDPKAIKQKLIERALRKGFGYDEVKLGLAALTENSQ